MAVPRPQRRQNTGNHAAPPRGAGGKWLPGASPNPGGRPKIVADIRDLARQHSDTAINTLVNIATDGKAEAARVAAAVALLDRGWGRPTQPLAGDDNMPPIGMTVEDKAAEIARNQAAAAKIVDDAFALAGKAEES